MFVKRSLRRVAPVVVVLGGLLLGGCAGDGAAGDAVVIDVELGNYWISPETLAAPAGVDVALRVKNVDPTLEHNLVAAGKGTRTLAPGEEQILPMGTMTAGMFPMWCDVSGHAQMGQTGTFVVTDQADTAG